MCVFCAKQALCAAWDAGSGPMFSQHECTGMLAKSAIYLYADFVGTSSMTAPVLYRASTATLRHQAGSFLHEAGAGPAECCRLGAEAGAAGHLLEQPPGSSGLALLDLGGLSCGSLPACYDDMPFQRYQLLAKWCQLQSCWGGG